MSGETLDIIQFCGIFFKRADHVHRWSFFLSRLESSFGYIYMGLSIGVVSYLTANILKSNVEVFHRSTYQYLKLDELMSE